MEKTKLIQDEELHSKIAIMFEGPFAHSGWGEYRRSSLVSALKYKNYDYSMINDIYDLKDGYKYIFLVSSNKEWLSKMLTVAAKFDTYPIILCDYAIEMDDFNCSMINDDLSGLVQKIVNNMQDEGCKKIAFYAFNEKSISDNRKRDGFIKAVGKGGKKNIFYNDGNLEKCFWDFFARKDEFDGVYCANGYAGYSLVNHLLQRDSSLLNHIKIVSIQDTLVTKHASPYITSVPGLSIDYGRAATVIISALEKLPKDSSIILKVPQITREEFDKEYLEHVVETEKQIDYMALEDPYYKDKEIKTFQILEKLLTQSDENDWLIMRELMKNNSYNNIADLLFMAPNTVKYRVNKMVEVLGLKGKRDLIKVLHKVIPNEQAIDFTKESNK